MSVEGEFFLSITGSIEHAEFYDVDNAYCKYGFHFGPEWSVVAVSYSAYLSDTLLRRLDAVFYRFQRRNFIVDRIVTCATPFRVSRKVWRRYANAAAIHEIWQSGIFR